MGLVRLIWRWFDRSEDLKPEAVRQAKPVRNPAVRQVEAEDGSLVLVAPLAQQGRGIAGMLAKWMKSPDEKQFELETVGAFVWNLCDGRHSFDGISKKLRDRFKMNRLDADTALLAFLQMLSQRRLIVLALGKKR